MKSSSVSFRQLFATIFLLCIGLFAAAALQAWTGPTATAPDGNVSAPINAGTTDQVKNAGLSLNALTIFGRQYIQSGLNIGTVTSNQIAALDVNGSIIVGNGGEVCQAVTEGAQRYNSTSHAMEYCNGTAWTAIGAAVPQLHVAYLTSGTQWTAPAGITGTTVFKVTVVGGGGGGGGVPSSPTEPAGGGGAGGTAIRWIDGLSPSSGYSYSIGGAGAGGSSSAGGDPSTYNGSWGPSGSSSGGDGSAGGNTSISLGGVTITAGGGGGGRALTGSGDASGGAGGIASGGTINITGEAGSFGQNSSNGFSGQGGSTMFGSTGGTPLAWTGTYSNGNSGSGCGSGGGGATGASRTGGAGALGCILIEWVQ